MAQSNAVGTAKDAAISRMSAQKGKVVENLSHVAEALRHTNEAPPEEFRPYMERAASQVERVSSYLQNKTLRDIVRDLEGFARREPALFLGGALVLGLIGGRFMKASSGPGSRTMTADQPQSTFGQGGVPGELPNEARGAIAEPPESPMPRRGESFERSKGEEDDNE